MKCCKDCRHFRDANHSKVYITPRCAVLGDDDARHIRQYVCGIEDARLYEPKTSPQEAITSTVDISTP